MAELLRDNLEVQRQVASQDQSASTTGQSTRNRRREIPDLLSWVSCFGVYMAVLTGKHPQMIKPLLAYQRMIVREARRCGGNGWLAYDTYFRHQVAGDPEADWSCLNTSLYAVTFLAQASGKYIYMRELCMLDAREPATSPDIPDAITVAHASRWRIYPVSPRWHPSRFPDRFRLHISLTEA